jgi:hypothetical protein
MTESPPPEDRLFLAASAIARGEPVDWTQLPTTADPETTTVVAQLRALEGLSRLSEPVPSSWGPFTILDEIGHGSFGTVYRALDQNLNLEVALKVVRPRDPVTRNELARALNEARLLAQITHPNVVRVYRAECIGQEVALSMELVKGRTLHDILRAQGPFNANETMLLGVELCGALAAVHGAQLVHGDIKAHNVMRAERGRAVLMDFGAGDDLKADPRASARRVTGTPLYLAPELFEGGIRTRLTDIYAVGVLLFHAATGAYPVEGRTREEVERQHLEGGPRHLLRDVRPDLPDAFIAVVDRATARRQEDRYQTAGELEAALKQALRGDERPRPVRPPLPWRNRLVAVGAAIAMGLGYWSWINMRKPADAPGALAGAPAGIVTPAAALPDTYQIEAAFFREQGGRSVRLEPGARVTLGDRISLQVHSSIPTYVFVVNEDDRGEAYLLFPLPGQALSNPLPAGRRHEIPGLVDGERVTWSVTSAGGREHFLIFASPGPSPVFDRIFATLPRPTVDRPASPVSRDLAGALRGVGGLAKAPALPSTTGLTAEFGVPLPNGAETARGVWVRQLTLENPQR